MRPHIVWGKKAYLHIKIDTGMSRLGFPVAKESVEEILKIGRLVYTDCEGMFTHFSKADETDKTTTLEQIRAFLWMKEHLGKKRRYGIYLLSLCKQCKYH